MSPVAFIIGAGGHVGLGVANKLKQEGYKVAVGSRNPLQKEGLVPITVDVSNTDSVIKAFAEVKEKLGAAPNAVVFNGSSIRLYPLSMGPILIYCGPTHSRQYGSPQSRRRHLLGRAFRRESFSRHHGRIVRFHPASHRWIQVPASG